MVGSTPRRSLDAAIIHLLRNVRSASGTTDMAGIAGASGTRSEYADAGTNARNVVTAHSATSGLQSGKRKRRSANVDNSEIGVTMDVYGHLFQDK